MCIWHRVYDAMFYISTVNRWQTFRGRLTIVLQIYIATCITARCKKLSRSWRRALCVNIHWRLEYMCMNCHRSCCVVSYLVSPVSWVEPHKNLIVASIWSRYTDRTEKWIRNLLRKILPQPGFEPGIFRLAGIFCNRFSVVFKMLINIVNINLTINLFVILILIQV